MSWRITTICDIVQDGEIIENDFNDFEFFDTEEKAKNYVMSKNIGDVIGYHGDAEDVLTDIYIDEVIE